MAAKYKKSPAIVVDRALYNSQAYIELPSTAAKVLPWFLARRQMVKTGRSGHKKWEIGNDGEIVFPYAEAEKKFGITRPTTFRNALDQLIQFGFIDINHHGGGMVKDANTYFISNRWEKYGTPEFIKKNRRKDTRGLGFTKKNWEELTGKKRRNDSNIGKENVTRTSNENVTAYRSKDPLSSNKNVTEGISVNFFINKGEHVIHQLSALSNKNFTIL